jgi:glucose-1-phosphate cytidylyltransferase
MTNPLPSMKTVLFAGGLGTRLSEYTDLLPKPMVEIGGRPMLWHIMHLYSHFGARDFVVAAGYRSHVIKDYFMGYYSRQADVIVDLGAGTEQVIRSDSPDWRVAIVDTGLETMTGGRLGRLRTWLDGGTFLATYGDGLADVDIAALVRFHRSHGKLATITAVRPPARFGSLVIDGDAVSAFLEKPSAEGGWINGGFFVFEPGVLDLMTSDETVLEREPLEELASDGQLMAYLHDGFFQPMDTLREKRLLEALWQTGAAPWKVWE